MVLTADSFSYNARRGTLLVINPVLKGPNGLIASAKKIDATGLLIGRTEEVPILVNLRESDLVLRRGTSGRFEFEDFLPKTPGPKSQVPFSVHLEGAKLKLIDQTGPTAWTEDVTIKHAVVDGVGQSWLANGDASIDGIGSATASVQNVPDQGLYIKGRSTGLDLAPALRDFRMAREGAKIEWLKHLSVESVRASGPFALTVPANSALSLSLDATLHGTGIGYDQYRFSDATFEGHIGETGMAGRGTASTPGLSGFYNGTFRWQNGVTLGAQVALKSPSVAESPPWLKTLIPKDIALRGANYLGWIAYDSPHGIVMDGDLVAQSGTAYGEPLDRVAMQLHADSNLVRLGQMQALWHGSPVQGSLEIGLKDRRLAGAFESPRVDLRQLATRFKRGGLSGSANAKVLIDGTTQDPRADFQANGNARYQDKVHGNFELAGSYKGRVLTVTRGIAHTQGGTLVMDGRVAADESVHMRVEAVDLDINPFFPEAGGSGNFRGKVSGTLSHPRVAGVAEAYALTYKGHVIPFASANLTASLEQANVENFRAQQGPTEARGSGSYQFKDGKLAGNFELSDFRPSELFGPDVVGLVDVPEVKLSGTAKNPVVEGRAIGTDLFYAGRRVDRFEASARLTGRSIQLENLTANLFNGTVTGSGRYSLTRKTGAADIVLKNLSLGDLAALPADVGTLTGTVDGTATIGVDADASVSGSLNGTVTDAQLNDTLLGSGDFKATAHGNAIDGSAQIGNLDGYQQIEHFTYDRVTNLLDAKLLIANTPLGDLYRATQRLYPDPPPNIAQILRGTSGTLNVEASIHGPVRNPDVELQTLDITNLTTLGRQTGEFKLSGTRQGDEFKGIQLSWLGPAGNLVARGAADINGEFALDGDLSDFDLSVLGLADDSLSALRGKVTVSFQGSGPTRDPAFRASIDSKNSPLGVVGADGTVNYVSDFGVSLDSVTITQSTIGPDGKYKGGIEASGLLTYRGVEGILQASLPLVYPFRIPEGSSLSASLDVAERPLRTLEALIPGLDTSKTEGTLKGHVGVNGPLEALSFDGRIDMLAKHLGFKGATDRFHDLVASLNLSGNDIKMNLTTAADAGGTVSLDATASTPGVRKILDEVGSGTLTGIWSSPLSGNLNIDELVLNGALPGKGRVSGTASGKLALGGSAEAPAINGAATLAGGKILLPSEDIPPGPSPTFSIDPKFNIKLAILNSLNVRSSAANIDLSGSGALTGSLKQPSVDANLVLQKGTFRLPTATVRLEPDGIVRPSYHAGSIDGHDARIDVDLEGRTRVTASGFQGRPQPYDVRLDIHGDLLRDGGLQLDATSTPPDLDKEQILALLGQASALQGLTSMGAGQTESRIRTALAGFALPSLLDPITNKIGATLGLESLTLQYDLQNQASIGFAKILGKDFTLSGTRQISAPTPGFKQMFDIELTYRSPKLRRFSFSIGADQDRPYKLSIEYGFRF